jgi:hypothetical protein
MLTEMHDKRFGANRIYLYDFQNNRIFDYVTDASVGSNSKNGKTSFGGSD